MDAELSLANLKKVLRSQFTTLESHSRQFYNHVIYDRRTFIRLETCVGVS